MERGQQTARQHPDEATTASWLEGRLDAAAQEGFEAHLASCAPCRAGVRVLREAAGGEASPAESIPPGFLEAAAGGARARAPIAAREATRSRRWVAAAAAIVVIAGAAITARLWAPPSWTGGSAVPDAGSSVFRGEENGPFAELSPRAGAVVGRDDLTFSWSPVTGADRYHVLVITAAGETLARIGPAAGQTRVAWPGPAPPPAGPLLWSVQALSFDRVIAESRPIPFEVR